MECFGSTQRAPDRRVMMVGGSGGEGGEGGEGGGGGTLKSFFASDSDWKAAKRNRGRNSFRRRDEKHFGR